jgi:GrpB-like predicted nucleotidyltransferase (UPF0157 family)
MRHITFRNYLKANLDIKNSYKILKEKLCEGAG